MTAKLEQEPRQRLLCAEQLHQGGRLPAGQIAPEQGADAPRALAQDPGERRHTTRPPLTMTSLPSA